MIIGLTGLYCAGKNHVAAILEKHGFPVLDVDKLGHQVLNEEKEAIFTQFGHDLKNADGHLNRKLLGQRVYENPEKLIQLENIVHPGANRLTEEWILQRDRAGDRACVINAALLHKSSVFGKLDHIILVTAPFLIRLFRAKRRDKLPWSEILKRFANQKDLNNQYLSINSIEINAEIHRVENSGFVRLERQIDKIICLFQAKGIG